MAQSNQLTGFVRIDQSGRDIPGSNVLRNKMPAIGKWREIPGYLCCLPSTTLTATPDDVSATDYDFQISCSGGIDGRISAIVAGTSTDIDTLTALLNTQLGYLGTFTNNGTIITLLFNLDIANNMCGDGTLTMTIVAD